MPRRSLLAGNITRYCVAPHFLSLSSLSSPPPPPPLPPWDGTFARTIVFNYAFWRLRDVANKLQAVRGAREERPR